MINRLFKIALQFFKFGCVGVSNTLITWLVYYFFLFLGWNIYIGYTLGFLVSTLNAWFWNNKYVFKKGKEERDLSVIIKTYISYGSSLILSNTLLFLLVDIIDISALFHLSIRSNTIAPVLILFITIPFNFILNKIWVYGNGELRHTNKQGDKGDKNE